MLSQSNSSTGAAILGSTWGAHILQPRIMRLLMRNEARLAAASLLLAVMGCSSENADQGRSGARVVPFDEVFPLQRAIVLQDPPGNPIGEPSSIVMWGDRLVVTDLLQADVKMFDHTGRHVATIGQPGSGPGEFRAPIGAAVLGGNVLGVFDLMLNRLTYFAADGKVQDQVSVPLHSISSFQGIDSGHVLFTGTRQTSTAAAVRARGREGTESVHIVDTTGTVLRSFHVLPPPSRMYEANFSQVVAAPVGRTVVSAFRGSNRIHSYDRVTGKEGDVELGGAFYREPQWPKREIPGGLNVLSEWANRQMWTTRIVALDSSTYAVGFTMPDPHQPKERVFRYEVATASGQPLFTTSQTNRVLMLVHHGCAVFLN